MIFSRLLFKLSPANSNCTCSKICPNPLLTPRGRTPRLCVSTPALNHQTTGMNPTACQARGLPARAREGRGRGTGGARCHLGVVVPGRGRASPRGPWRTTSSRDPPAPPRLAARRGPRTVGLVPSDVGVDAQGCSVCELVVTRQFLLPEAFPELVETGLRLQMARRSGRSVFPSAPMNSPGGSRAAPARPSAAPV